MEIKDINFNSASWEIYSDSTFSLLSGKYAIYNKNVNELGN